MPVKGIFTANPNISTKSFGKPGYCSLCSLDDRFRKPLTSLYRERQKAPAINAWLENNVGKPFDRRVIYAHREHITHPKDRLVGSVAAQRAKGTLPATATEEQLLDAVITAALGRVIDSPEDVTIDQGIKAASARMQAKASARGQTMTLVLALTQPLESTPALLLGDGAIEGEVTEIT